ncbi:MAG TPA: choice-of-anchor V domain-containing protein, partial [Bryobacteraceae bacterium]|nr:choice-of-anchor V domain-containing protein [Bryobacteraceae bacterium]
MTRSQRILCAAAVAAPVIVFAYGIGPPARHTRAPGDPTTCTQCHTGSALGTAVQIAFTDGTTSYTPGATKRMRVTVTDSANRYGFQATARLVSNLANGQAGTFRPVGSQQVLCEDDRPRPSSGSCPASAPVEFIEHSSPSTSNTFEFEWAAPATNVGDVRFYVAANAANGNGENTGDRIHAADFTATAAAAATPPSVNSGGVVNGASFQPGIVSGSWVSIFGSNFASARRDWEGLIQNGVFPTEIDGVRVNINNKAAAINFISPGQINVQVPDDTATGIVNVEVITSAGRTTATANMEQIRPGLFGVDTTARRYVSATISRPDGAIFIGNPADLPGTRAARPGEIIELWGTGFGATREARPAGRIVTAPSPVTAQV